jgi:hypothetical protein
VAYQPPDEEAELERYAQTQRVRAEYNRLKAIEEAATLVPVPEKNVEEELDTEYVEPEWRIEGLHIVSSFTTITAAMKTGKSTLMLNLIRSLVDGAPFMGKAVKKLDGNVGYLNMELDPNVWLQWAREMGITDKRRVRAWHLRGERFPLYHPELQKRVITWLQEREIEALIIDPGHRLLRGWPRSANGSGGENSNDVVAEVCQTLQEIKKAGGVKDLFIPLHTGHSSGDGQHTRGAVMWQDDPDHLWSLWSKEIVKGDGGIRQFSAEGRNVDFKPIGILWDPHTHRYTPCSIEEMQDEGRRRSVVVALHKLGGNATTADLKLATKGFANSFFTEVLHQCYRYGLIEYVGKRNVLCDTAEVREIVAFGGGAEEVE